MWSLPESWGHHTSMPPALLCWHRLAEPAGHVPRPSSPVPLVVAWRSPWLLGLLNQSCALEASLWSGVL